MTDIELERLKEIQRRHEASIMSIPNVNSFGIGDNYFVVHFEREGSLHRVPDEIEGIPVKKEVVGTIRPLSKESAR